jgi:hypothetical protein
MSKAEREEAEANWEAVAKLPAVQHIYRRRQTRLVYRLVEDNETNIGTMSYHLYQFLPQLPPKTITTPNETYRCGGARTWWAADQDTGQKVLTGRLSRTKEIRLPSGQTLKYKLSDSQRPSYQTMQLQRDDGSQMATLRWLPTDKRTRLWRSNVVYSTIWRTNGEAVIHPGPPVIEDMTLLVAFAFGIFQNACTPRGGGA